MSDEARNDVQGAEQNDLGQRLAGKYMTFKLGDEEYGLEILKVREIIGLMEITRVPRTPDYIKGVINLRGKVEPVIDLRLKFNMDPIEPTDQTVIIVVQFPYKQETMTMGIMVDEVLEVLTVEASQIEPAPNFGTVTVDPEFIMGVGKHDDRVVFLLDIGKVLTPKETDEVAAAAIQAQEQ